MTDSSNLIPGDAVEQRIDRDAIHARWARRRFTEPHPPSSRDEVNEISQLIDEDVPALLAEAERLESLFRAADAAAGIQARRAERAEANLAKLTARLRQVADAWEANLPETILTEAAADALRAEVDVATS